MHKYSRLLSPIKVGNHVLKNRMFFPNASPHFLQGPETFPAAGVRALHAGIARNGAAIVEVAEWNEPDQHIGPADMDMTHFQSYDLNDPSVHNYLSLMSEEVHLWGSKLLISARVDWPEGYSLYGRPAMGPPRPGQRYDMAPQNIIDETVASFVKKMDFYKRLGYDGMSMRVDLDVLKLPGVVRDDAYDPKTVEGRTLFVRQLYAAVKERFGGNFMTEATIAWEQPWGYGRMEPGTGVSFDEVLEFCRLIDKDVDIFQVRENNAYRAHPMGFNFTPGDHPAAEACLQMKKEGITALLAPVGGFQEPEVMEQYLEDGKCDMFGMARAFFADPEYGVKLYDGRSEDIVPCLKCNKCHGQILRDPVPWSNICSVNPIFGLEHDVQWLIPKKDVIPKNVAVVGGGPAGMRAAIECARLGHTVTLYEKSNRLGGQLLHADYFDFKWPVKNFKNWLIRQLDKEQVKVILNCEPSEKEIKEGGYDAVLAATGAEPQLPASINGLRDEAGKALYPTCDEIWGKEAELGHHVVIIGGSETGMETAIYLLRAGHKVTVLTRQKEVAHDASKLHYITWVFVKEEPDGTYRAGAEWEKYDDFTGAVGITTKAVDGNTVTYADADGTEHTLTADDIVICGGHRSRIDEALSYAGLTDRFEMLGDCDKAGNLHICNRQAYAKARMI